MRIAIATQNGHVAAHFGRCPQYTIVDLGAEGETQRRTVENPGHEPGRIPQFLNDHGAELVIAGGMGPRAQQLFDSFGIDHIVGVQLSVDDAVAGCIDGSLNGGESLCSHPQRPGHEHDHDHHHGSHQ